MISSRVRDLKRGAEWHLGLKKDIILNAFFFRITNIGVKNGVKPKYHQTMSASRLFWFLCFMLSVSLRFLQDKPKIVLS